jgi:hypothetical protein
MGWSAPAGRRGSIGAWACPGTVTDPWGGGGVEVTSQAREAKLSLTGGDDDH